MTTQSGGVSASAAALAVYGSLRAVQRAHGKVTPIASYELYKVAREEELCTFRSVCRVLAMHHGKTLPKAQQRLLDDLAEELYIPEQRAELEWLSATSDAVVGAVQHTAILKRRVDFFDGVDDVPIDAGMSAAVDDGQAVHTLASGSRKVARSDTAGGASHHTTHATSDYPYNNNNNTATHNTATATGPSSSSSSTIASRIGNKRSMQAALSASVARLAREIEEAAQEYLYSTDIKAQQLLRQKLEEKREALLRVKQEASEF